MLAPEAAICVTAKIRSRRLVPPVMRTPPLLSPKPCEVQAMGDRGTKARSTAAAIARLAPSQSMLESIFKSGARDLSSSPSMLIAARLELYL
jgi:hypothetical protein